jgi:ABC-type antimicrobial peptide transport system permease subunit
MIRPGYALKLARTKLHSKRGMLYTSIIVSSLLFAVLVAGIIIFTAAGKSATSFIEKANGGKYLVQVQPVISNGSIPGIDPTHITADNIKQIRAFEANYYAQLKAKYTSLGVPYTQPDPSDSLLKASSYAPAGTPTNLRYMLNYDSPLMEQFTEDSYVAYAKTAKNTLDDLKQIASKYNGSGYYASQAYPLNALPSQNLITNGQESYNQQFSSGNSSSYGYFTNAIHNSTYHIEDQNLLARYITDTDTITLKGVPVIVSAQEATKLFGNDKGIGQEPKADADKTQWLKQVQTNLTGTTYQTCYRNSNEVSELQKIQQDYADTQANVDNKTYVQPTLIYNYPTSACGDITVKSDTRTLAKKTADAAQMNIQKKLGMYVAPEHHLVTYQIVGFIETQPYSQYTASISSYLKNLLSYNNDSFDALIPAQMYHSLPSSLKIDNLVPSNTNPEYQAAIESLGQRVVAFDTIAEARSFMDNETCPSSDTNCKKLFTGDPYGSNYLILDQISVLFKQLMAYALPAVLVLAAIIIWFTMSRVMAENRKETAIYRAMGAKRFDIAAIYLMYTFSVAIRIVIVSLGMGVIIALAVNQIYGQQLTDIAAASFGALDSATPRFNLFDLTSPYILYIAGAIVVVCFLAVLQPLIRNVLRAPIRDMREE